MYILTNKKEQIKWLQSIVQLYLTFFFWGKKHDMIFASLAKTSCAHSKGQVHNPFNSGGTITGGQFTPANIQ